MRQNKLKLQSKMMSGIQKRFISNHTTMNQNLHQSIDLTPTNSTLLPPIEDNQDKRKSLNHSFAPGV
jgi:hypothetical protein